MDLTLLDLIGECVPRAVPGIYMNGCEACAPKERALSWRTPVQDVEFVAAHGFSGLKVVGCVNL